MDLVLSLQNSEHAVAVRSSVSNSNSNSNITGPGTGSSARDDGDNGGGGGGRSAGGGTEALVCGSPRLAYPEGLSWHSVASLFALRRTVCVCSDQEAAAAMEQKQALEDEEQSRAPPRSSTVSPALRSSTRALTLSLNSSGSSGNSDSRGGDGDDDGDSLGNSSDGFDLYTPRLAPIPIPAIIAAGAGASLFSDQDKHSSGGITSDDSDDNGNNLNGSINSSDHHRGQQQQQQQPRRLRTVPTAEPTAGPTTKTSCLPCRVDGLRTSCPAALESTPFARLSTPRSPPSPPHRGSSLTRDRGAKSGLQQQQQPEKPGRAPSVKSRVAVRAAETTLPPRRIHRVPPLNLSRTAPATTAIWEGNGIGKGLIVDTAPSPRSPIGLVASLAARECQSLLSSPGLTDCLERMMQEEEDAAEREIFDWYAHIANIAYIATHTLYNITSTSTSTNTSTSTPVFHHPLTAPFVPPPIPSHRTTRYMSSPSPDKALTGGTSVSSERAEDWEVALDSLDVALDLALEADCSSSGGVVCLCVPELHLEEDDDWELEEEEDGVVLQQQCTPGPDRLTEAASTTSDSSTSTSSTSSRSRYGNSTNNNSSSKSPLPHSPLTVMARLKGHARTPAPAPAPAHEHVSLDTGSDSKGGGGAARFKECLSPCGSPSPFCKSGNGGGGGGGRSKQPSKSACPHRPPLTAD